MTKRKASHPKTKREKLTVAVMILIAVVIVGPTVVGYLKFGYYAMECGGMPVAIAPRAENGRPAYFLPGDYTPGPGHPRFHRPAHAYTLPGEYAFGWGWVRAGYVCTEQEAIERGIIKYPLRDLND